MEKTSKAARPDETALEDLVFFLGGRDLEMETIRELLEEHAPGRFVDKGLRWGAKASDYRSEIASALERNLRPVLIELDRDLEVDQNRVIVVDHHGRRAGSDKQTSLEQVFHLLQLPAGAWTRSLQLVAENDRGAIDALRQAGATPEEIVEIRNRDRRAQGVTLADERSAEQAVSAASRDPESGLTVVRLPHGRTSPVTDFLDPAYGGPGCHNLLIVSPGEVNFFGSGEIVERLDDFFPCGWKGGSLPERGFWGFAASPAEVDAIAERAAHVARSCLQGQETSRC